MRYGFKHGMWKSKTYAVWAQMVYRCTRPTHPCYHRYGGRGIKVCKQWLDFRNFLADMGVKPEKTSIDRINNEGHYEPGNCRWTTQIEQCNNTRRTIKLTYNGKTLSRTQWDRELGFPKGRVRWRHENGWSIEEIVTIPFQRGDESKITKLTHEGKTLSITEWAKITGIPRNRIAGRVKAKMPMKKIFSTKKLPNSWIRYMHVD